MDTILLCENFLLSLVIFSHNNSGAKVTPRTIPTAGVRGTNLERTGESKYVVITLHDLLGMQIIPTCMMKDAAVFSKMQTKCDHYNLSPQTDLDFDAKIWI